MNNDTVEAVFENIFGKIKGFMKKNTFFFRYIAKKLYFWGSINDRLNLPLKNCLLWQRVKCQNQWKTLRKTKL